MQKTANKNEHFCEWCTRFFVSKKCLQNLIESGILPLLKQQNSFKYLIILAKKVKTNKNTNWLRPVFIKLIFEQQIAHSEKKMY